MMVRSSLSVNTVRAVLRSSADAVHGSIAHAAPAEILPEGVLPGAVQVPGDGQPIGLMADGPTSGGYPKIATVTGADLPRLARAIYAALAA